MSGFESTEQRVDTTAARFPGFPRQPALLVRLIKRLAGNVQDAGNARLRQHGINRTDYDILMMLYGSAAGSISASELAAAAGEKVANITRVCNSLCDKSLIHRAYSDEDRRKVELRLTDQGTALVEQMLPDMAQLLNASVQNLDAREQATLEQLLKKMLAASDHMDGSA